MALASAAEAIGRVGERFRGIQELKAQLEEQRRRAEEDLLRTSASQIHFSPSPTPHPSRESPVLHGYPGHSQPRRNSLDQSKVSLSFGDLDASAASANSLLGMTTTSISTNSRAVLAALRALQDKIRRVESEKSALESEVARLKGEMAMQHEGSERSRVESTSRSETKIAELQRVVNQLRDELSSTRAQADASRREVNSTHRQEMDALNEVVAGLRRDNTDLRVRLQETDDELRHTVKSLEFEHGRMTALEDLKKSAEDRAATIARSAEDRISLITKQAAERLSASDAAVTKLREDRDGLISKLSTLQHAVDTERDAKSSLAQEVTDLADRLDNVTFLNKTLVDTIPGSPKFMAREQPPSKEEEYAGTPIRQRESVAETSFRGRQVSSANSSVAGRNVSASRPTSASRQVGGAGARASSGGRRTIHDQLQNVYGDIPFVLGGNKGPSHSILANVQMSLSQPQANGLARPIVSSTQDDILDNSMTYRKSTVRSSTISSDAKLTGTRKSSFDGTRSPVWQVEKPSETLGSTTHRRGSIGQPVAAVPEDFMNNVLESLEAEYNQLDGQYKVLCEAAAAGTSSHVAEAAANVLTALHNKRTQISMLQSSQPATMNGVVRSPVRNPDAVAKRVDTLRTLTHLKGLAHEVARYSDLDVVTRNPSKKEKEVR